MLSQVKERQSFMNIMNTLREESVCGRKFCGSGEPQNLSFYAEKTFTDLGKNRKTFFRKRFLSLKYQFFLNMHTL